MERLDERDVFAVVEVDRAVRGLAAAKGLDDLVGCRDFPGVALEHDPPELPAEGLVGVAVPHLFEALLVDVAVPKNPTL